MTITVKHAKRSYRPDGADQTRVQPSDWNADHVVTGINIHDHTSEEQGGIVVGVPGPKGDTGDPGADGLPGAKGDTGDPGYTPIKGVDYFDGAKGDKGDTGDTGPAGADSTVPGPKGDKGDTGDQGLQGLQGEQGPQGIQGIQGIQGEPGSGAGYAINVQALTSSPGDGATTYFGMLPKAPTTTANTSRCYIPKAGTIKVIRIWCYSGTAGTAENWSLYIRINNTTDTLIKTLAVNTNARDFYNDALNITVIAGDYFEIKSVQPTWATNPATTIYGGYVYIE